MKYRPRHSAWKNNRDSLIFWGLHENWTLALRFQVSGVSSEKARASLKPDTWNLCFEKASPRSIMSKKKTYFYIMLRDLYSWIPISFHRSTIPNISISSTTRSCGHRIEV